MAVSLGEQRVTGITFNGNPIDDERLFRVGLAEYHFKNMNRFLGISEEEVNRNAPSKTLATSAIDVLDENLSRTDLVVCPEDERWINLP